MGFTVEQLNKLKAAMATGTLSVKYDDKEIVYRSLGEMQTIQRNMEIELGIKKTGSRRRVMSYDRLGDRNMGM